MKPPVALSAAFALITLVPSIAGANCIVGNSSRINPSRALAAAVRPGHSAAGAARAFGGSSAINESGDSSIVGLWAVTFLVGNGPDVFDRGFEQWHADGTEFTMDVAVPPAAGNICVGVWAPSGPRSVKLHHVGWNWDTSVSPAALAGVFVLDMVVTVDKQGNTFTGEYVTDSYDNDGHVIPALHAEGVIQGQRIRVQ